MVAGVGFGAKDPSFVKTCFGLFAILRSDTQNDAMFDPDFCVVWALSVAMCFFRLFFSHNYVFPSPQNRFKGPKAVRFKNLRNSRKQKNETNHKGWFRFLCCLDKIDAFLFLRYFIIHEINYCLRATCRFALKDIKSFPVFLRLRRILPLPQRSRKHGYLLLRLCAYQFACQHRL